MSVFISHSFKDADQVRDVRELLERNGVAAWPLSNLREGNPLASELRKAIGVCDACVFVATTNSIAAPWCAAEVGAFWATEKPIIVYIAEDVDRNLLPPQVRADLHVSDRADIPRAVIRALENRSTVKAPQYFPESSDYGGNTEWNALLDKTHRRFDLMGISLDGWRRTPGLANALLSKARLGCRIRVLMMHDENPALEETIKPEDGATDFGSHRDAMKRSQLFYEDLARQDGNIELRRILKGCPHASLTLTDDCGILIQYFYHINWANGPLLKFVEGSVLYEQVRAEFDYLWRLNGR